MKNTLKTIQTVAKIAYIVAVVIFVCSIIGACGCVIGIIGLLCGLDKSIDLGSLHLQIINYQGEATVGQLYLVMIICAIACVGSAVIFGFVMKYLKHERAVGTPFTHEGAKEMFRLGIITLAIGFGIAVVSAIITAIANGCFGVVLPSNTITMESDIGFGLLLMIFSLLFQYGAENIPAPTETEKKPESK